MVNQVKRIFWDTFQDNNDFILHKNPVDVRWNQINKMIKVFEPPFPWQLDNVTWTNFNPLTFLEEKMSLYLFKRVEDDMGG